MATSARTDATWATADSGPGHGDGRLARRSSRPGRGPSASGPSATLTGTVLDVTSSSRTLTKAGSLPSTLMRGSTDRTVTGTLVVPACGIHAGQVDRRR